MIYKLVSTCGLIPIAFVLVPLTLYLVKNKRKERFEWSIVVLITIKYTIYTLRSTGYIQEKLKESGQKGHDHTFYIIWEVLYITHDPICHWIYAS